MSARILWGGLFLLGFLLRFLFLDLKPVHFDEGVNGWFVAQMWKNGHYGYDPTNYHGPLFFYFLQISEAILGFGIHSLRTVSALAGVATIGLFYCYRRHSEKGMLLAASLIAVSPAFVFFGRSAIHESLFVFFQLLSCLAVIDWLKTGSRLQWNLMWAGFLGAFLTKETWVISAFPVFWLLLFYGLSRRFPQPISKLFSNDVKGWSLKKGSLYWSDLMIWLVLAAMMAVEFGADWTGPQKLFTAFLPWTKTGLASGHNKPMDYWISLVLEYEWGVFLGLLISFLGLFHRAIRVHAIFGLSVFAIYSLIPYKTPWCSISLYWPLLLGVGQGWDKLSRPLQRVALLGVVVSLAHGVYKTVDLNFHQYANDKERYVYVQSTFEFGDWSRQLWSRYQNSAEFRNKEILILSDDTWPLPYLFQRFPNVHYTAAGIRGEPALVIYDKKFENFVKPEWSGFPRKEIKIRAAKEKSVFLFHPSEWGPI